MIKPLIIALGMYSSIPMPHIYWTERNLRYALCFFPVVGAIIGALLYGLTVASIYFSFVPGFFAAVATAVPVIVSGGLHLDGFCDTADALFAGKASREERLLILKDVYTGAFAVISAVLLLLVTFGVWQQIYAYQNLTHIIVIGLALCLIRALSGLSVATFRRARSEGLAVSFGRPATDGARVMLALTAFLLAAAMIYIAPVVGGASVIALAFCYLLHYVNCMKNFGGVTGDLAGFFLEYSQLAVLAVVAGLGNVVIVI